MNYEASLSYAQLSRFNIERSVLKEDARRQQIFEQQLRARETYQLVDSAVVAADMAEVNDLVTLTGNLTQVLSMISANFTDGGNIYELFTQLSYHVAQDPYTLQLEMQRLQAMMLSYDAQLGAQITALTELVNDTLYFLGLGDNSPSPSLAQQLTECLPLFGNDTDCDSILADGTSTMNSLLQRAQLANIFIMQAFFTSYTFIITDMYTESPLMADNVTEHVQCMGAFQPLVSGLTAGAIDGLFQDLALAQAASVISIADFVASLQQATAASNNSVLQESLIILDALNATCRWFVIYGTAEFPGRFYAAANYIYLESLTFQDIAKSIDTFVLPGVATVEAVLSHQVMPIVMLSQSYMLGNLTKLQLYEAVLQRPALYEAVYDLIYATDELLLHLKTMQTSIDVMPTAIHFGWYGLLSLKVPVLTNEQILLLGLINMTNTLQIEGGESLLTQLMLAGQANKLTVLDAITQRVFAHLIDSMLMLKASLQQLSASLQETLTTQQHRLVQFKVDTVMDESFYL